MSQTYLDISPLPTILYGTEIEKKIFISYNGPNNFVSHKILIQYNQQLNTEKLGLKRKNKHCEWVL